MAGDQTDFHVFRGVSHTERHHVVGGRCTDLLKAFMERSIAALHEWGREMVRKQNQGVGQHEPGDPLEVRRAKDSKEQRKQATFLGRDVLSTSYTSSFISMSPSK